MSEHNDDRKLEDLGGNASSELGRYIEKIEKLEEEKAAIGEDIKSVYAEAAGNDIDKKALRQIIKERRADLDKTLTLRGVIETYRRALSNLQGTLGDWARSYRSRAAKQKLQDAATEYREGNSALIEFLKRDKPDSEPKDGDAGEARP